MQILIDGNDGVGKTTLAKKLQAEFNIKSYIHLSGKDPRDLPFYFALLQKKDVMFDRSFMDERIYSEVLDRKAALAMYGDTVLHQLLASQKIVVIICHTEDNVYDSDEDQRIIKSKKKIDRYFKNIARKYGYIYFDPHKDSYEELLLEIKQKL